jgi:heme exporter protein B
VNLWLKKFSILFKKELLINLRNLDSLISILFFTTIIVLIFYFGFSSQSISLNQFVPAFIWLSALFGGMLVLTQSYGPEKEGFVMDGIRQAPHIGTAFFLSKFVYNLLVVLTLELLTYGMLVILFNLSNPLQFLATYNLPYILGAIGFSAVGTTFANMVASHNRKEAILSIMLYPILIPLIVAVLKCFEFSASGQLISIESSWIKILVVFDIIYFVLSVLIFDELIKV